MDIENEYRKLYSISVFFNKAYGENGLTVCRNIVGERNKCEEKDGDILITIYNKNSNKKENVKFIKGISCTESDFVNKMKCYIESDAIVDINAEYFTYSFAEYCDSNALYYVFLKYYEETKKGLEEENKMKDDQSEIVNLKYTIDKLNSQIRDLKNENKKLHKEIDSIKSESSDKNERILTKLNIGIGIFSNSVSIDIEKLPITKFQYGMCYFNDNSEEKVIGIEDIIHAEDIFYFAAVKTQDENIRNIDIFTEDNITDNDIHNIKISLMKFINMRRMFKNEEI